MSLNLTSVSLILILFGQPSFGSEVDHFTALLFPIPKDATAQINKITDEYLDKAILKANSTNANCNKIYVSEAFYTDTFGPLRNDIEVAAGELGAAFSAKIPFSKSIYQDFTLNDAPLMVSDFGGACCNSIVKIKGHMVGIDKFSHFIQHGYAQIFESKFGKYPYFKRTIKKITGNGFDDIVLQKSSESIMEMLIKSLKMSHVEEMGSYGLSTNGVYSYADIAANFDGVKFWYEFITTDNYIRCSNNKFIKVRPIDWSELVSDAWDESFNHNTYRPEPSFKVQNRIQNLMLKNPGLIKALDYREKCRNLALRYGEFSSRLLNPNCASQK